MRIIWIITFLLIGSVAQGQVQSHNLSQSQYSSRNPSQNEIRGVVMNLLGQPVRGTEISVTGFEEKTLSSESGDFKIKLEDSFEESLGYVMLRHPEYAELRISLQEFRGTTGRLSVMLDTKGRNCRHVIQ